MSVSSNSSISIRNGHRERETFCKFFECWVVEQNQHLQELVSTAKDHKNGDNKEDPILRSIINKVITHYDQYYKAKSRWAKQDILSMFTPLWCSTLEDAFLWLGGWRPTMAFHLLYSKSGLQLEAALEEMLRGLSSGDLGDLSPSQLDQVDELQKKTVKGEREISEKMAEHQETLADSSMVALSNVVSEKMRDGETVEPGGAEVEIVVGPKEEGLVEILKKADELRLRTLKEVLGILTPIQAVYFLIAAAELHLRIHDWGKKMDVDLAHHHPQRR